jgi:site-specific DNA recombinase
MQAEADQLRMTDLNGGAVLAEAEALYDRWPTMPTDDKRKIAEALVEKIVIGEGEIDITFSYLPTSEELCKNQQQLRGLG